MTQIIQYKSNSCLDTEALGVKIANAFKPGDIIALYGDLGSGKTTFTRGLVRGISPSKNLKVKSPSFAIVNQYDGDFKIYHIDCYRLENIEDFEDIGIDEFLFSDAITIIEWPERIEELLPKDIIKIRIETISENERKIEVIKFV